MDGLIISILIAFLLDLLIGDPEGWPHPVRLVGKLASWLEEKIVSLLGRSRFSGFVSTALIVGGIYFVTATLIHWLTRCNSIAGWILTTIILYTTFAIHDLAKHARKVFIALRKEGLDKARQALSKMVGRDTDRLDEKEVIRATVESVAENTVDGVMSPIFYALIGGAPLALAFKAASTLDSMVGYRNPRYLHFGWASARLDDILNFIPARISLVLFPIAALFCGLSARDSFRTALRDGGKNQSPNAGLPEAAMAGALGVQLGGFNFYGGVSYPQPLLGDSRRDLVSGDILRAKRLMFVCAVLFLSCGILVRWVL